MFARLINRKIRIYDLAQAMIVNRSQVDMAIMLGLCIGHDTLFIRLRNKIR